MLNRLVIASIAVALPTSAFCACAQSDLKGSWRFQANPGTATANARTTIMDCIVNISATGAITPKGCVPVSGANNGAASITVNNPARTLAVSDSCTVTLAGTVTAGVSDINFGYSENGNSYTWYSNKASLTLAPTSKDVMLGTFIEFASGIDYPNVPVMAVRRH